MTPLPASGLTVSPARIFRPAKAAPVAVVKPPVVTLTLFCDPELEPSIGMRVRNGQYSFWGPELPVEGIEIPGVVRVEQYVAPPPAPKSMIADPYYDLLHAPAATAQPPMLPRVLANLIFDRCAFDEAVEETPEEHPIFQDLKAKAIAGMLTVRGLPAGLLDPTDVLISYNLDWLCRSCALPPTIAAEILRPTAKLADMALLDVCKRSAVRGFARATVRDTMLAEHLYTEAHRKREEQAKAAAAKYATEVLTYDLSEEGLVVLTIKGPRVGEGVLGERSTLQGDTIVMKSHGLPIGRVVLQRGAVLRSVGTHEMTRATAAGAIAMPDEITARLRADRMTPPDGDGEDLDPARPYGARHSPEDFTGSALTVEGRHALRVMRRHAFDLWRHLHSAAQSEVAAYLHHLICTLPVAYFGAVSWDNAVDAVRGALLEMVAVQNRRFTMNGPVRVEVDAATNWPAGLPRPEMIESAMARELANVGSAWIQGEMLKEPSIEEAAEARKYLNPMLFEDTVAAAVAGLNETTSQNVYDALHRVGLTASGTPSPELRGRVSAYLEAHGWIKTERRGKLAKMLGVGRGYVWVRPVVETDADNEAVNNLEEAGAA